MIRENTSCCTKISANNGNDNNEDYLYDSEFWSSVQIEQLSTCIDIKAILKELDAKYDNK